MVKVLNNIHFAERYEALRIQYSFDLKESFKNYDNQYVLKMLQEIGYEAVKYRKREKKSKPKKKEISPITNYQKKPPLRRFSFMI